MKYAYNEYLIFSKQNTPTLHLRTSKFLNREFVRLGRHGRKPEPLGQHTHFWVWSGQTNVTMYENLQIFIWYFFFMRRLIIHPQRMPRRMHPRSQTMAHPSPRPTRFQIHCLTLQFIHDILLVVKKGRCSPPIQWPRETKTRVRHERTHDWFETNGLLV